MDDMRLKFYSPVTTGSVPMSSVIEVGKTKAKTSDTSSFKEILKEQIEKNDGVLFSKHAVKRVMQNNIEISQDSLKRLNHGVKLAEEKNLDDTLILVDRAAFVVNVKNNTVITMVNSDETGESIFTNIDGAVIV